MNSRVRKIRTDWFRDASGRPLIGRVSEALSTRKTPKIPSADKRIAVISADRGGYNAVHPILERLTGVLASIHVYLFGSCRKQYDEGYFPLIHRIQYTASNTSYQLNRLASESANLLVLTASQSSVGVLSLGVQAFMFGKGKKIIAIEDMYGSLHPMLKLLSHTDIHGIDIDRICVIDEFARNLLINKFPAYRHSKVVVATGNPHFDRFFEMKTYWSERRRVIRESLSLPEDLTLVLVVGGLNGTDEMLSLLHDAMKKVLGTYAIILRPHPRSTAEDQEKTKIIRSQMQPELFRSVPKDIAPTADDLLPAADIVMSPYSTINHIGMLCELPGVVYVGTPSIKKDLFEEKGVHAPFEVHGGGAWYVTSVDELTEIIQVLRDKDDMNNKLQAIRKVQAEIAAQFDGRATERVLQQIREVLES